jgi:hypothetical protein
VSKSFCYYLRLADIDYAHRQHPGGICKKLITAKIGHIYFLIFLVWNMMQSTKFEIEFLELTWIDDLHVFLHSITPKKVKSQLHARDIEWWMRRRELPTQLRQRVRQNERQIWAATRGIDETATIWHLPEGLRRGMASVTSAFILSTKYSAALCIPLQFTSNHHTTFEVLTDCTLCIHR